MIIKANNNKSSNITFILYRTTVYSSGTAAAQQRHRSGTAAAQQRHSSTVFELNRQN